jgi:hypothetical protein
MWSGHPSPHGIISAFFPSVRLKPVEIYKLRKNLIKVETYLSLQSKYTSYEHKHTGDGMIALKKNDKIIIIAAVVIIVLVGISIAVYQSPETPTVLPSTITVQNYDVVWKLRNGSINTVSGFAGKKAPYQGNISIPVGNIKTIVFNLTWTDDHMTLLKRMGLDTLTLEVTTPNGDAFIETNTSAPITGQGSITLMLSPNIIPPVTPIKASDVQAAQAMLKKKPYYDDTWTNKDIHTNVSVKIGELRLLKKIRDKGNSFDLSVAYQYYEGSLKVDNTINTGFDNGNTVPEDPWADQVTPPYISMIISTGCGRFV